MKKTIELGGAGLGDRCRQAVPNIEDYYKLPLNIVKKYLVLYIFLIFFYSGCTFSTGSLPKAGHCVSLL
jgi:hypothetical protein